MLVGGRREADESGLWAVRSRSCECSSTLSLLRGLPLGQVCTRVEAQTLSLQCARDEERGGVGIASPRAFGHATIGSRIGTSSSSPAPNSSGRLVELGRTSDETSSSGSNKTGGRGRRGGVSRVRRTTSSDEEMTYPAFCPETAFRAMVEAFPICLFCVVMVVEGRRRCEIGCGGVWGRGGAEEGAAGERRQSALCPSPERKRRQRRRRTGGFLLREGGRRGS